MRKQLLPGLFKNTNPFGYKFCHMHKNMKLEEEISYKVLLRSSYISIREGASVFVKKRYHLDFPHFRALSMWTTICFVLIFSIPYKLLKLIQKEFELSFLPRLLHLQVESQIAIIKHAYKDLWRLDSRYRLEHLNSQ